MFLQAFSEMLDNNAHHSDEQKKPKGMVAR